jgi:hypothetical protein
MDSPPATARSRASQHERRGIEQGAVGVVNAADEACQCVAVGSLRRPQGKRFGRQAVPAMAISRRRPRELAVPPGAERFHDLMTRRASYEASSPSTWSIRPASSMFEPGKRAAQRARTAGSRNRLKARNKRCWARDRRCRRLVRHAGGSVGVCASERRISEVTARSTAIARCEQRTSTWRAWGSRQARHCTMPSRRE